MTIERGCQRGLSSRSEMIVGLISPHETFSKLKPKESSPRHTLSTISMSHLSSLTNMKAWINHCSDFQEHSYYPQVAEVFNREVS